MFVRSPCRYGYDYTCKPDVNGKAPAGDVDICLLQAVPFAGAECSDAAGAQVPYAGVMHGGHTTPPNRHKHHTDQSRYSPVYICRLATRAFTQP